MVLIIVGLLVLILFTLLGAMMWAGSEIPLAVREIAINTRKDRHEGSSYVLLKVMSIVIRILATLFWIGGLVLSFLVVQNKFFDLIKG